MKNYMKILGNYPKKTYICIVKMTLCLKQHVKPK